MNTIKNIILKILLIICLLIGMSYAYRIFFYEKDLQQHSDVINLVYKAVENDYEVIYLGESSNTATRSDDEDKRSISRFVADYFPDLKVGDITKVASHAGIYYELLRNIPPDANVKTVIVTLNARSFNADWIYSKLETPLQKSMILLKDRPPLWNRFLLSFKGYDIKTNEERLQQVHAEWRKRTLLFPYPVKYTNVMDWDKAMADEGIKKADGSYDETLTPLACHYIKTYAFQIDTQTNVRIKDFDKIVDLAKKRNWNLIFNLMAENVEMADNLVGKDLIFLMEQNRDLLIERYRRMGVAVVDNFNSVEDEEFVDRDWTTEHYAEQGRKTVARNVAQTLKTFYPDYYQELPSSIEQSTEKQTHFFNNCDDENSWGQQQTITDENAFSGEKSSKTGKGEPYGVTFEHRIRKLPDSLKTVNVEMQLFQQDTAHNAEILLEISEINSKYVLAFPVKNAINAVNEWQKVNCQFELGENFYKGYIVKIFLYNTSDTVIYCDDIKVVFE